MKNGVFIGFDSSNYTTSVAVINSDGELIYNGKQLLSVDAGERGLRQSDAVFAHIKNYPELIFAAKQAIGDKRVLAIGASVTPRRVSGSYMPCFLVGEDMAYSAALSCGAPVYKFSHQCGHIMAAIYSSGNFELLNQSFAAYHVSGGTTELLRVTPEKDGFSAEKVGGTKDISAGQLIDRIGVLMGLNFPAGPALEELAKKNDKPLPKRKISQDGLYLNLSGVENIATELYCETNDKCLVSAFVLDYVGRALILQADTYVKEYGQTHFVFAGGVLSNSIIKNMISEHYDASFAEPRLSSDNAVGIACLARRAFYSENNN